MAASLQGCAHTIKIWLGQPGERDASHPDGEHSTHKAHRMAEMINAMWDMLSVGFLGHPSRNVQQAIG